MVLFDESGHLTNEGLDALHAETLDERQRLAVSEHLCACDGCLERYTDTLREEALVQPLQPLAPGVAARLASTGRRMNARAAAHQRAI